MMRRARRLLWALALAGVGAAPTTALAQVGVGSVQSGTYGASNGLAVNPYASPLSNPFLNPYMAQFSAMTPANSSTAMMGNPAMFLFAAQAANGGIGSGQISGVRPGAGPARPGAAPRGAAPAKPSSTENLQTAMVPGGNAAHYFNRAPRATPSAGHYYNRQGSYFPKNGR